MFKQDQMYSDPKTCSVKTALKVAIKNRPQNLPLKLFVKPSQKTIKYHSQNHLKMDLVCFLDIFFFYLFCPYSENVAGLFSLSFSSFYNLCLKVS